MKRRQMMKRAQLRREGEMPQVPSSSSPAAKPRAKAKRKTKRK